ncbi:MAG: DedA family protein [Candidatus Kryptoniota bacterium]
MTELLVEQITNWISLAGYAGITALMALESMVAPVPSEAVMPFAGFLIFEGKFAFPEVALFSTLGSIIGSVISYYVGFYGGRPFVIKYGKYLMLDLHHLDITEKFFNKYGDKTIFISRFVPVVRHLISLPAGAGKMQIIKFGLYTFVGAALWNSFLAYVGFHLRSQWSIVRRYSSVVDAVVIILIIAAVIYFLIFQKNRRAGNR